MRVFVCVRVCVCGRLLDWLRGCFFVRLFAFGCRVVCVVVGYVVCLCVCLFVCLFMYVDVVVCVIVCSVVCACLCVYLFCVCSSV